MKKKIVVILVMMLLITTSALSTLGTTNKYTEISSAKQPLFDYGDAPDDSQDPDNVFAYPGVAGKFPSLYDTVNVRIPNRRGPYHLNTDTIWLGNVTSVTTKENDALIVDGDIDDCDPKIFVKSEKFIGLIVFDLAVSEDALTGLYYVNVLFDQNQDGEWKTSDFVYREWVVENWALNILEDHRGQAFRCICGPFRVKAPAPVPAWIRITLTRELIDKSKFTALYGWDGSAPPEGFSYGETEDWLITEYFTYPCNTKDQTVTGFSASRRITGNGWDGVHAEVPCDQPRKEGWLQFWWHNPGCKNLTVLDFNVVTCPRALIPCNCVGWRVNGIWKNVDRIGPPWPAGGVTLDPCETLAIKFDVWWTVQPCQVPDPCWKCGKCGCDAHELDVNLFIDPEDTNYFAKAIGNITYTKPAKVKLPIAYSFWDVSEEGLTDIITYTGPESIVISPSYVTKPEYMGSCHMTWEETQDFNWLPLEETVLSPGDTIKFSIPMESGDVAAFVRYEVRYALSNPGLQDAFIDRFISEAILSEPWPGNSNLWHTITNFEVQNSQNKPVDNFEVEFYGDITPSHIVDYHDPDPPGEPYLSENTWYGGWGCPPAINTISNGINVTWEDTSNPIQPGQSVYFGLFVDPNVPIPTEISGHWNSHTFPPNKPHVPDGPRSGEVGVEYIYATSTTDHDEDLIYYLFDWGNGTTSDWLGAYDSGDTCEASHIWEEEKSYSIKVKAKDIYGAESPWSDPLSVSMPKNKLINTPLINFLENHPHLFPLLRQLLGIEI
jgi:hypothetical protein